MAYFLCRLNAPRASFPHDMSETEVRLMGEHAAYWTGLLEGGVAVAFGPVADPAGFWGLALVEAGSEAEAAALAAGDPVIRAAAGFRYDVHPMPDAVARPAPRALQPDPMREGRPARA